MRFDELKLESFRIQRLLLLKEAFRYELPQLLAEDLNLGLAGHLTEEADCISRGRLCTWNHVTIKRFRAYS